MTHQEEKTMLRMRRRAGRGVATLDETAALVGVESEERFERRRRSAAEHFEPRDEFEARLAERMVEADWLNGRFMAMQSAALEEAMEKQWEKVDGEYETADGATRMWLAWRELAKDGALEKLVRADGRYEARFQRTLGALKGRRA